MPIKFGKTSRQYNRMPEKPPLVYDYMKCKSNADLIEAYNKDGIKRKLRAKVRVEIDRRNKLGLSNIIFTDKPIEND